MAGKFCVLNKDASFQALYAAMPCLTIAALFMVGAIIHARMTIVTLLLIRQPVAKKHLSLFHSPYKKTQLQLSLVLAAQLQSCF